MARISRLFGVTTATLVLAVLLGACATPVEEPTVAPTVSMPTPTATTDAGQAAFEAAEATYRAYIEAQNAVDFADPATFEPLYALTTEPVTGVDREAMTEGSAKGLVIGGETRVESVVDVREDRDAVDVILLEVCNDISSVTLTDSAGNSLVAADRGEKQRYRFELSQEPVAEYGYVISGREALGGGATC